MTAMRRISRQRKLMSFKPEASRPKHAIALIYDLEGFSRFFNQPDVHEYVPKFINHVNAAFSIVINGGVDYWANEPEEVEPLLAPVHEKFLGDGMLYIWTIPKGSGFEEEFVQILCNRLWNLQSSFGRIVAAASDQVPVLDVPTRVRCGIARGTVYELHHRDSPQREYIGFCINLASRLQNYCDNLGFIGSARLGLSEAALDENGYIKVIATRIKGFPREIVIVDKVEYDRLDSTLRGQLFESLPKR